MSAGSCLADEANKSLRRPAEERDQGQGWPRVKGQPRIDLFPLGTSPLVKNFTIDSIGQVAARVDESQAISERKGWGSSSAEEHLAGSDRGCWASLA